MKKARCILKNKAPFSLDFNDFYFNDKDGLAESRFVYTEAFEFKEKESFIIAELGFGIGLNFFLSLQRFLRAEKKPKRLFYVSIEGFYLSKEELEFFYKKLGFYEEFKEFLQPFLKFYPKAKEGIYRFYFKDLFLDLVFGEALQSLKELDFKADVWFLDGFSPSKNEAMFSEEIIEQLARLSCENAQLYTFSASSLLQKNLQKHHFVVQKLKGFAKRQMIRAYYQAKQSPYSFEAYFQRIFQTQSQAKKVAIIGGGIAGASLAYELSLRAFEPYIFEKQKTLAAQANESAIVSSLILKKGVLLGEFSEQSFYEASRFYAQIFNLKACGVYEFAYNQAMLERFKSQKDNVLFDFEQENKAFLEDGLCVSPKELICALVAKARAKLYLNFDFSHYQYSQKGFKLFFKNQILNEEFDYLIYAMGASAKDFIHLQAVNLSKLRGQLSYFKPFLNNKAVLNSKAYICPQKEYLQAVGATYDRLDESQKAKKSDDMMNIKNISEFLNDENLVLLGSNVGFRSYSSDRFPIIGALYDEAFYKEHYKKLFWTKTKAQIQPKNVKNVYLSLAYGSRAFSSAIMGARYICALMCNEPLPLYKRLVYNIHPARFLIRKLKKGLKLN